MKIKIWYIVLIFVIFSCSGFALKKHVVGNYYLIATDVVEDIDLCYYEPKDNQNYGSITGSTIFAIGFNNKYIIAKQHPRTFPNPPDTTQTNYYILPIKSSMDWRSKNGLMGPLTLEQFNEKRKELNIPKELTFNNVD